MTTMVSKYGKAIIGFIAALLGALYVATSLPGGITLHEWIGVLMAGFGVGGGVAVAPRGVAATVQDVKNAKAIIGAHEAP